MSEVKKDKVEKTPSNGYPAKIDEAPGKDQGMIEINVFEVLWMFLVNWWKIVALAVVGAAAAFAITYFYIAPTYTATASIYVVSPSSSAVIDVSELQLGTTMSDDYLYLMTARPLMETVAEEVGQGQTWGSIRGSVSVSSAGDRIITISATSTNARLAADIANSLAKNACEYLPDVTGVSSSPNIIETALVPTGKNGPDFSRNVLIGFFVGAALVCGILFLKYLLNDTFVVPDDLVSYYGMAPLAVISEGDMDANGRKKKKKKKYGYYSYYSGRYYTSKQTNQTDTNPTEKK